MAIDDLTVIGTEELVADTTAGGATVDGTISPNEYGPGNTHSFAGGGQGFGGVLNGQQRVYMTSDASNLYVAFVNNNTFNDFAVVYLDSQSGGFDDSTIRR